MIIRFRNPAATRLGLGGVALAILSQSALAQTTPFPDEWFFPNLPKELTALVGKAAPELKLKEWIGEEVNLDDAKGKVVVIDFWATWCGPCMAAIPENVETVSKYKEDGLVFLGIHDARSGWERAPQVVDDKKINYPVARDADGGLTEKAFGLGFWPTYVVIDRAGIVRGAGLVPGHVADAVKLLLAEPPPPGLAQDVEQRGLAVEFYFGGDQRPRSFRAVEGKPMPALKADEWKPSALEPAATSGRVLILYFLSSGNRIAMRQGEVLAELEKEMGPQGAVFIGVCPPDDDWEQLTRLAEEGKLPSRLLRDARAEVEAPMPPMGATALEFGVKFAPVTVVIDRSGIVRGTGVKPEKVKELIGVLLTEAIEPSGAKAEKEKSEGESDGG